VPPEWLRLSAWALKQHKATDYASSVVASVNQVVHAAVQAVGRGAAGGGEKSGG
jgi:hypothetical protein